MHFGLIGLIFLGVQGCSDFKASNSASGNSFSQPPAPVSPSTTPNPTPAPTPSPTSGYSGRLVTVKVMSLNIRNGANVPNADNDIVHAFHTSVADIVGLQEATGDSPHSILPHSKVVSSQTVGDAIYISADIVSTPYWSDHAGVMSTLTVKAEAH